MQVAAAAQLPLCHRAAPAGGVGVAPGLCFGTPAPVPCHPSSCPQLHRHTWMAMLNHLTQALSSCRRETKYHLQQGQNTCPPYLLISWKKLLTRDRVLISTREMRQVSRIQADIHHMCTPVFVHAVFKAIFRTIRCFYNLIFL